MTSYSVASGDVVRVRMPFSPEAPAMAPYWFHDNTTGAVTGLYKDLLDAVFTAANLTYSLGGFSEESGYGEIGDTIIYHILTFIIVTNTSGSAGEGRVRRPDGGRNHH